MLLLLGGDLELFGREDGGSFDGLSVSLDVLEPLVDHLLHFLGPSGMLAGQVVGLLGVPGEIEKLGRRSRFELRIREAMVGPGLAELPKPVGVYAPDLTEARDLATACYELDIDVPEQVSILGTGDDERCLLTTPNLSTVDYGSRRIGRRGAELLESLMAGEPAPAEPVRVAPTGVVGRQSTDALAVRDPDVVRAVRWIRENIEAGPNVAQVAREAFVSRRTLELHFKRSLGRTVGQEIRRCRVERAKMLLRETQLAMVDVAVRSGFASRSHLNLELRRAVGMSPKEYRRSMG